jgi:hypothetical protein
MATQKHKQLKMWNDYVKRVKNVKRVKTSSNKFLIYKETNKISFNFIIYFTIYLSGLFYKFNFLF